VTSQICVLSGFPRVLENLENNKFIFQAWKCPGILQSQENSLKCPGKNISLAVGNLSFQQLNCFRQLPFSSRLMNLGYEFDSDLKSALWLWVPEPTIDTRAKRQQFTFSYFILCDENYDPKFTNGCNIFTHSI
jgi:hypothetical protein